MPTKEEMNSLAQEIIGSYEARVQGVAQIRKATQEQLQELDRGHQAMARQQRADLRAGVASQLQELDRSHQAMAQGLREGLAKVHADLDRAETRRKAGVRSWMEEVAAGHRVAQEEWQNLAATVQAKRVGAAVAEAPPLTPVAEAPEEEEEEFAEVGQISEEFASLSRRVFEYLASHPDGKRLGELEREFGLGRFQAARAVRHLINEGKAEKRGLFYFAV